MKIKYFEGKEDHGIMYDWQFLRREFRKLKTPEGLWNPTEIPFESCAYTVALSTRSTGKTTQAILFGMLMRQHYGTQTALIRCREEQIMPMKVSQMLDTIRLYDNGRYVPQITNGRWNSIQHVRNDRSFIFCNRDENGEVFEKDQEPFLRLFHLRECDNIKSGSGNPKLDLIIFDEFVGELYVPEYYSWLMNIVSSFFRERLGTHLFLLGNTIRPNCPWFRELEIAKELKGMKVGEQKTVTASGGAGVFIHLFDKPGRAKSRVMSWLFGFKNPQLNAIRGGEEIWVYKPVPHIVTDVTDRVISQSMKIDTGLELLGVDFVLTEDRGIVANIHPVTKIRDRDIVLTNGDIWDKQHQKGRGYSPLSDTLELLERRGKVYFADNETGTEYASYMAEADGKFQ